MNHEEMMFECRHCGGLFDTAVQCANHKPCESAIEKAVREEREAVVRALKTWTHKGALDGPATWQAIGRGEHRK